MKWLVVQMLGIVFVTQLVACGGGGGSGTTPSVNRVPTANAGGDQTVNEQTTVTLLGSGTDSDGSIVSFSWIQITGTSVTIANSTSATASFDAPVTTDQLTLTFELTVTDNDGAVGRDTLNVVIRPVNQVPTANAGGDQTVNEQTTVTLLGSGTDSDGSIVSFSWIQITGTSVTIANSTSATASFDAPVTAGQLTLTFELAVTDNEGATSRNSTSVIVNPVNTGPISHAGTDQSVEGLTQVTLSGSGSDIDGIIISYQWVQTAGTEVALSNGDTATASFEAPDVAMDETLTFELTVTDNEGASNNDSVAITVTIRNMPPVADAGSSQFVTSGNVVALDASASNDIESNILTYSWARTDNSVIITMLDNINAAQPIFTAPALTAATTVTFEVTVTDGGGLSDVANVNIAIQPIISQKLNDTGINRCGDYAFNGSGIHSNSESCANVVDADGDPIPAGQDGHFGRDATQNDDFDGRAGFSFTKIDSNGNPMSVDATDWKCVRDNVTGLIWEVKTTDGGLQDRLNSYTWYNPDISTNGGDAGTQNGGQCTGSLCDTNAYAQSVNDLALCGFSDWTVPTLDELTSIVDYSSPPTVNDPELAVDIRYFPNTQRFRRYWSSSTTAISSNTVWCVGFGVGNDLLAGKGDWQPYVRLVRRP